MQLVQELDLETLERIAKQEELLARIYRADLARDPAGRSTETSRSNLIAIQHTVKQMYGKAVPQQSNLITPSQDR